MRDINLIVIHCSATKNGESLFRGRLGEPDFQTPVERIDEMHRTRPDPFFRNEHWRKRFNGSFTSIGYHFVIYVSGMVATGRHLDEVPSQAAGFNARAIGICLIGTDRFTPSQWNSLAELVRKLCEQREIRLAAPRRVEVQGKTQVFAGVCGHRDLSPDQNKNGVIEPFEFAKTCPGFDVATWLANDLHPEGRHILNTSEKEIS